MSEEEPKKETLSDQLTNMSDRLSIISKTQIETESAIREINKEIQRGNTSLTSIEGRIKDIQESMKNLGW